MAEIKGGCFCGKIRYKIVEEPLKAGVCHCRCCQRLTGGSCWPFIVVKVESIEIEGKVKEITRMGSSGKKVHCGFCKECSTTLFGRPEVWPYIRTVSASTLDDPKSFYPSFHAWTEEMQPWIKLGSDVKQFQDGHISSM